MITAAPKASTLLGRVWRLTRPGVALCVAIGTLSVKTIADNVGNTPQTAESLNTGAVVRVIEPRNHRHFFGFSSLPFVTNQLTLSTGTVRDLDIDMVGPDGDTLLLYTNTAAGTPLTLTFYSTGPARRLYCAVNSLAEFSTGSYHVAFSRAFADTDVDGLPDAWEMHYFGSLTMAGMATDADNDGVLDREEWVSGTNPNDPSSRLAIRSIDMDATGGVKIVWNSRPDASYRVGGAVAPTGPWSSLSTTHSAVTVMSTQFLSGAISIRVFRVELLY